MGRLRGAGVITGQGKGTAELPDFGAVRVLVADDNAVNREVVIEALRSLNVIADTAFNGRQAMEKFSNGGYGLIFMDCSMPEMDGFEATLRIREHERVNQLAPTPVIALTAHIAGGDADQWRDCGMNAMITKPFTLKMISECLSEWIVGDKQSDGGEELSTPQTSPQSEAQPPAVTAGAAAIDQTIVDDIRDLSQSGSDLLVRTIGLFEKHAPEALENVRMLSASDDKVALADAVHALKSLAANIGARQLAEHCNSLEMMARNGEEFDLPASLSEISGQLSLARDELDGIRQDELSLTG